MPLHILDVVQFWCQRVVDVDDDDLPVRFFLIKECHYSEYFDLLDLTSVANQFANFAHIEGIIVALSFGFRMNNVWIFPCLKD